MGTSGKPPQYVIVDRLGSFCVLRLDLELHHFSIFNGE